METIILKVILCSGIVLGLYYLFLAKEKTFTFNRFYLLLGLVFAYSIPFVTIETKLITNEKPKLFFEQEIPQQVLQTPVEIQAETFDYTQLLWLIYFIISGILILKMLYAIVKIKRLKGRKIIYKNRNIVLLEKDIAPFSFLNSIYLSENYFKDGKIDDRIFLHEEIHVKQKHSFDVLFIEIVKAFSWFNPFIYFYKNVMIINHEFIADEEVITKNENIKNYQELILNEVLRQQNLNLIHQFNFNNTKKRFIMMTNKNSKFAKAKKYFALPISVILFFAFAEKIPAQIDSQKNNHTKPANEDRAIPIDLKTATVEEKQLIKEFDKGMKTAKIIKVDTVKPKSKIKDNEELPPPPPKVPRIKKITAPSPPPPVKNISLETLPEYPGGINAMRNKISRNFNGAALKGDEGLVKSNIVFTINEKGEVLDIKSNGSNEIFNTEAIKAVKLANKNITWKPATRDGNPVSYIFKIPLAMAFQSAKKTQ